MSNNLFRKKGLGSTCYAIDGSCTGHANNGSIWEGLDIGATNPNVFLLNEFNLP